MVRYVGLALVIALALTLASPVIAAQDQGVPPDLARMLRAAERAINCTERLLHKLNITSDHIAWKFLRNASRALDEAKALVEAGRFEEAKTKVIEAFKYVHRAILSIKDVLPAGIKARMRIVIRAHIINRTINRLEVLITKRVAKINESLAKFLLMKLNEARVLVREALDLVRGKNVTREDVIEAIRKLNEAHRIVVLVRRIAILEIIRYRISIAIEQALEKLEFACSKIQHVAKHLHRLGKHGVAKHLEFIAKMLNSTIGRLHSIRARIKQCTELHELLELYTEFAQAYHHAHRLAAEGLGYGA